MQLWRVVPPQTPTARQTALAASITADPIAPLSVHCRRAGYGEGVAGHQARRQASAPGVQKALKRFIGKAKVSDQRLAEKLSSLLDAQTVKGKDNISVDDNPTQFATAELFLKLKGYLRDDKDAARVTVIIIAEFMPLVMPFIDENKRGDFAAKLEEFRASRATSVS